MTEKLLLMEVRKRLEDESLWWHGGGGRNPHDDNCRCLISTVLLVAETNGLNDYYAQAVNRLDRAVPLEALHNVVTALRPAAYYNDYIATHKGILALIDAAIAIP